MSKVMSSLRNLVIGIFRVLGKRNIAKTLREMAAKPYAVILSFYRILAIFNTQRELP